MPVLWCSFPLVHRLEAHRFSATAAKRFQSETLGFHFQSDGIPTFTHFVFYYCSLTLWIWTRNYKSKYVLFHWTSRDFFTVVTRLINWLVQNMMKTSYQKFNVQQFVCQHFVLSLTFISQNGRKLEIKTRECVLFLWNRPRVVFL